MRSELTIEEEDNLADYLRLGMSITEARETFQKEVEMAEIKEKPSKRNNCNNWQLQRSQQREWKRKRTWWPFLQLVTMMRIASWNLCLGLKNKKDYIYDTLHEEKIDICLFQEVEILKNYPMNILSSKDFKLEIEKATVKARCAIAIKNNVDYTRRNDLEDVDLNMCVIDLTGPNNYRIINFYRPFNPPNNFSQLEHFAMQMNKIDKLFDNLNGKQIIIAGDFNLDDSMRFSTEYRNKQLFEIQNVVVEKYNLSQIITFHTWSKVVNNNLKESTLDHFYV